MTFNLAKPTDLGKKYYMLYNVYNALYTPCYSFIEI